MTAPTSAKVCMVVALASEARPLIDHYRLRAVDTKGAFPLYQHGDLVLIVSGVGKVAAAAATAFLQARCVSDGRACWINVGIAGHPNRSVGEGIVVHRITDAASDRSWYPPQLLDLPCDSDSLITVDAPVTNYRDVVAYDMEAAGFFPTASRFSAGEIIQCYKVVSDNRAASVDVVTGELIESLIRDKLADIDALVAGMGSLFSRYESMHREPTDLKRFLDTWRFSTSQRHRLRRLLLQWEACHPEQCAWGHEMRELGSAKAVVAHLEQRLSDLPVSFG